MGPRRRRGRPATRASARGWWRRPRRGPRREAASAHDRGNPGHPRTGASVLSARGLTRSGQDLALLQEVACQGTGRGSALRLNATGVSSGSSGASAYTFAPSRPGSTMAILDTLNDPGAAARDERRAELAELADELRTKMIRTVQPHRRAPGQLAGDRGAHAGAASGHGLAARPDRVGHRPPGLRAQAAHRPRRALRARCASWTASAAFRDGARASTTSSTAAMPAPG